MTQMTITFGNDYHLHFDVEDHPIAQAWLDKMRQRHKWPLDDAKRFYGFDNELHSRERAEQDLRTCMTTINAYQPVITRPWTSIDDQDFTRLHQMVQISA